MGSPDKGGLTVPIKYNLYVHWPAILRIGIVVSYTTTALTWTTAWLKLMQHLWRNPYGYG